VSWYDLHGPAPLLCGMLQCEPFVEDPPYEEEKVRRCEQAEREYHDQVLTTRRTWNVTRRYGCRDECVDWLRASGNGMEYAATWQDVARCVVAGVGVLARLHPHVYNNDGMSPYDTGCNVFVRVMLRLQRELLTWDNEDGAPDPTVEEVSEGISRRGGTLTHPFVMAALMREGRWKAKTLGNGNGNKAEEE